MERLTVKWTDKVYDTLDPVDILDNEYSKTNYNKLLTKLGEYEDLEEIFREKMTDTACEFLKDKEEFSKWLDRTEWIVRKCDEYARAEEQGLLLKLPCKVGTTVYVIDTIYECDNDYMDCIMEFPDRYQCERGFKCEYEHEKLVVSPESFDFKMLDNFNITVFLTKEEAEEKLKELNISERN